MAEFHKNTWHNIIKYATVIAVIAFISFLFPNISGFSYQYKVGRSWNYDNLVAGFNFPILKSKAQIKSEKQDIKIDFLPFYDYKPQVQDSVIDAFKDSFHQLLKTLQLRGEMNQLRKQPDLYEGLGINTIKNIYNNYVISATELKKDTSRTELIRVVNKSITSKVSRARLLKLEAAKRNITGMLSQTSQEDVDYLIPILNDVLIPNTTFNGKRTHEILQSALNDISTTYGVVEQGETIISHGQLITPEINRRILSYEKEYVDRNVGERKKFIVFLGYLLLTTLIVGAFLLFLQFNARPVYESYPSLLFMLMWIVLYSYLVSVIAGTDNLSIYMIPYCIVPILIIYFFSDRLALFTHIVIIFIASFLGNEGYEFTILQLFVGIVTVLTFKPSRYWVKFFRSILFIFLAYVLVYFGLNLIRVGSINEIEWTPYIWLFLSSFLTLLAFTLVPLFERLFGFTSNITLSELSDLNRPLLKRLSTEASGTFQHSLQVSNLSEAAAEEVGANSLLVKVASLYHDVGKLENPSYFIENQSGFNPHSELDSKESAQIILAHVPDGVTLARQKRIPSLIIDFIKTHHGTTRVEYFYQKYKKQNPDLQVDPQVFTYPGPKPQTKEQAIVMIADTLEAACKSLDVPDGDNIDELVDNIIEEKVKHGQFSECDLTFKDLDACSVVFKKMLKSIHHVRVKYPEQGKKN